MVMMCAADSKDDTYAVQVVTMCIASPTHACRSRMYILVLLHTWQLCIAPDKPCIPTVIDADKPAGSSIPHPAIP